MRTLTQKYNRVADRVAQRAPLSGAIINRAYSKPRKLVLTLASI